MSWPFDGAPRFVVRPCEGYLTPRAHGGKQPGLSAVVLDRAYCYRGVAEYKTEAMSRQIGRKRMLAQVTARAQAHADRLNAKHEAAAG